MMWLFTVLIIAVAFFIILKYQNFHGHVSNFVVLAVMLFLVLSMGYVYVTKSPDLSTLDGVVNFLKSYVSWVSVVFGNTGKVIGYAVNQDWKPALNLSAFSSP